MENIFHTRCHISNKLCNMIIDSVGCVNIASAKFVRKLNVNTIKHERSYRNSMVKLMWRSKSYLIDFDIFFGLKV